MIPRSILVIGISGSLAQKTVGLLLEKYPNATIRGIDARPLPPGFGPNERLQMERIPYRRNSFERLFRDHRFDLVLNLGRFSHSQGHTPKDMARKLEFSVIGSRRILDLSLKSGVKKAVTLSTFHVYGALPDNPTSISEEMPLRASLKYPDLRHVVDMDNVVAKWMWRHQNAMDSVVLRPCNIVGPSIRNTISRYLTHPKAPYPMDFNPMMQFIHEHDMANVVAGASELLPTGIYNVAPPGGVIGLRQALKAMGNEGLPIPFFLAAWPLRLLQWPRLRVPGYLIDYLIYSCLIDSSLLHRHLPKDFFRYSVEKALQGLREASTKKRL
ncbi:MAG: NAD-dependent epimerase/dehydratase family protein [Bacteriovoracales bacterium]|nr:NAD-dependent epimerase/dehydratase family protein [Bacteriovoracales bacterium]